jgi:hypothetical protein
MRDILEKLSKIAPEETKPSIIMESPEGIRDIITKKINKIDDENDLTDVLRYTNRFTIKGVVDKFATIREYKDVVAREILIALADAGLEEKQVKKFLDQLSTKGILDVNKLMTPGIIHNYENLITPAFRETFDLIKVNLSQRISGKIGEKGDVGKGEYMLDIICPDINRRGAPGDLDVAGTKVELKAGSSGRLGPSGSVSLVGRFNTEFLPFIRKLVPKKVSEISQEQDFNLAQNMDYFSDFFETTANIRAALTKILEMHYPTHDVKKIANSIVDSTGKINGQRLKEEMLRLSYEAYKIEKGFDGIIIMDDNVTSFLYIESSDDIVKASKLLLVRFPSWVDAQSNCVKITLAKTAIAAASGGKKTTSGASEKAANQKIAALKTGRANIRPPGASTKQKSSVSTPRKKR